MRLELMRPSEQDASIQRAVEDYCWAFNNKDLTPPDPGAPINYSGALYHKRIGPE